MTEREIQRKLVAILYADVVGYSRLMGEDEAGTHKTVSAFLDSFAAAIEGHKGAVVHYAGDAVLAEFQSVFAAVTCAVDIQRDIAAQNAGISQERQVLFRVGVNLGEVIVARDDIFGDGVNIAARLESLADPGGVCVSASVHQQVKGKIDVTFEDMGDQRVKNIAEPVQTYRVVMKQDEVVATTTGTSAPLPLPDKPSITPADPAKMAYTLPEMPSIAVLPFDNLTGDPAQDYIGDGLTETIIAVLATMPDLFVIARYSSFTFKGQTVSVQEVAERLGVRYVLEGSVQKSGERLRVTTQLVDAVDGKHLWAERYDHELKDLFALQDDITQSVLVEINIKVGKGGTARELWSDLEDIDTWRAWLQADHYFHKQNREDHLEAERLLREALKKAPDKSYLNSYMGYVHWQKVSLGISTDVQEDFAIAREYADRSLEIHQRNYFGFGLLALLDLYEHNYESAIAHADRARDLAPNHAPNIAVVGWVKSWGGQPQEAIELLKLAMRLEPYHWWWLPITLIQSYLMVGDHAQARVLSERLLSTSRKNVKAQVSALTWLAVISDFEGNPHQAKTYVRELLKLDPKANVSSEKIMYSVIRDKTYVERRLNALRQAGLPE